MLALAGGAIAALATPPTDIYPAMFVGLALLAWALRDAGIGFWRGFGLGALWGTAGGLIGMRFVPSVIELFTPLGTAAGLLAHLLLSAAQSLHWALGMGLAAMLRKRLRTPLEIAFGSGVLLALMIPSVFVWSPAGLLSPWLMLLQSAELIGERGVSVLMAIIATLLLRAVLDYRASRKLARSNLLPAAAAAAMLAAMLSHGAWAMSHHSGSEEPGVRIALIHAGIDPEYRWEPKNYDAILGRLKRQTTIAETTGVELSIWPEAAYPFPLPHTSTRAPRDQRRQLIGGAVRGPILFGFIAAERPVRLPNGDIERNRYNSATVVTTDGALQPSYDKMELLWFGETVPLGRQLPWLRRMFQRSGGLIPGEQLRPLRLPRSDGPDLQMGVLNCYEDTLPGYGREVFATVHPNLLVNVTNDAWFVGTQAPELHMRLSVLRSIELRRDMVRAVNLGVSAWIDATGRTRLRNDSPEPGFVVVEPTPRRGAPTVYARFGDLPAIALLLAAIASAAWRQRRRRENGDDSP